MVTDRAATSRPLGRMETATTITDEHGPFHLVAALRLTPAPDPTLLQAALDHARRRHPALRARIEKRRRRYGFHYDVTEPIRLVVSDTTDWTGAVETGLNVPIPYHGPLATVTLVRHDGSAHLVAAIHHAIVDGVSATNLLAEVLSAYAGLAAGETLPDEPLPVPPAADDLFPPAYRGARFNLQASRFAASTMAAELRYRLSMRRAGGPRVDRAGQSRVHSTGLDAATTAQLTQAARRRRITLASAVQAAALSTVHRLRYDGRPVTLRTYTFPDQRPYLEPAQTAEPLAAYLAMTWQDVPLESGDLWAVATAAQQRIDASVRGPGKFYATTVVVPVIRMAMATKKMRMGNVAVTHTGHAPLAARYGPLTVDWFRGFVSSTVVGPEITVRSGVFARALSLDVVTLDTDMDRAGMEGLAAGVVAALREMAAS